MSINTGGPAFPTKRRVQRDGYLTNEYEPCGGMTLRDYFAAKAMHALLAHPDCATDKPPEVFARAAYVAADAMLKQREVGNA